MKNGMVYLIGAGCGDMDLITLKGLNALKNCDALVYDDLIDEDLINSVPEHAEKIYMGKRSGKHSSLQEEISAELVKLAKEGKVVARLKGGDPFVFGRGGEEAIALDKENIYYEEIPGISSSIAIPAAAGIPVTHRGLSRSFHVITGRSKDGTLPENMEEFAKIKGTLIFLMGLGNLEKITESLMSFGKSKDTPAAVISGGNSANPATVRGTLENIAVKTRDACVKSPAVIVIGEVAELNFKCNKPLEGVKVGLTGTDSITSKLKIQLNALGAQTIEVERSIVEPLPFSLQKYCEGKPHWLVFTSANGVRLFFKQLQNEKLDIRKLYHCKFAVIGSSTGSMLSEKGIYPDLCPDVYTSLELAKALCNTVKPGEDVILLRADNGAEILPQMLREHNIPVDDISIYCLKEDEAVSASAKDILDEIDYITFSSAGGTRLYLKAHGEFPKNAKCVCIGDVTAKAMDNRPYILADEISAEGIVKAIINDRNN